MFFKSKNSQTTEQAKHTYYDTSNKCAAVANNFKELAEEDNKSLSKLQIIKLTYISYGIHLAYTGNKLFPDIIEAWKNGPVIPSLYFSLRKNADKKLINGLRPSTILSHQEKETIDSVWYIYGNLTRKELIHLMHLNDSPWSQVYVKDINKRIPDQLIKKYYTDILELDNNGQA